VAHRLSTFADANRIFVFDDGKLLETGTYEELILRNGVFSQLVQAAEMKHEQHSPVKQTVA
jgi:ATP-binding cassette, subfamily B, bacterial